MKTVRSILFFLLYLSSLISQAQERPPIQVYTPEDYGAENQNWSVSQSKEKFIYVANNKGLLEFNGANWQLYLSPNESIMRSVKVIDDLIFTGSYMEFGYWQKNEFGSLFYTSLSEKLDIQFLEDEEFWNIIGLDDYILFQSLKRIYIYNKLDGSYLIIDSDTTIYKMFKISQDIYFQRVKDGIYKIVNGRSQLVSDHPILKNNLLVNIFNYNGKLLIETEDNGFFILDSTVLQKWDVPANDFLSKVNVYRSIQLKDKSFMLGTISNGLIHLSLDGEIKNNIDNIHGLSSNTVHSIFEDVDGNLWSGLENGINCVNINSPFSIYKDDTDKMGTVYASAVYNEYLYLGTNQGLFYKPLESNEEFIFIEGTQGIVWSLVKLDGLLFCGHNSGTFTINEGSAEQIADIQGTWNIIEIDKRKDLLLQGNYDGLYVLQKINGTWRLRNKIDGFNVSSKFFEIHNTNEIFVNHEYKGVINLKVDNEFMRIKEIALDSTVKKGLKSSLIKYNNDIIYSYKEGIFKFNTEQLKFDKDTLLSKSYSKQEYYSGRLIPDYENTGLWSFSDNDLNYISLAGLIAVPKINKISFSQSMPRGLAGYENISHIKNQEYLLGTSNGYIIIDLDKFYDKPYQVNINSITKSDVNNVPSQVNKNFKGVFKNAHNNIEFTYSVPEFDKYFDTKYQYRLSGIYNNWSKWSTNSSATFNNLPHGQYTFNLKAKVGNKIVANIATYTFEIERPWYLSNVMIALYALAIMFFSLLLHTVYKRYYKKQQEKLLYDTNKELELKKLENQQQLMQFNNDKLRQDIENKNRELGISTMSLIKKNEFLNNIKSELKNADGGSNLKQVIKIIDRNLNNTDDWHLFEQAFNSADKDFLKKIKTEHPVLTSNDLRLCAYLRLNLSSKEIAPLLNISPRSVEVKRYRLRKKMNLPHESSLTNYILEI